MSSVPTLKNGPDSQTTIEPLRVTGLALVGPYGNVWAHKLFDTKEKAEQYLDRFWNGKTPRQSGQRWRLVPATMTISADAEEGIDL